MRLKCFSNPAATFFHSSYVAEVNAPENVGDALANRKARARCCHLIIGLMHARDVLRQTTMGPFFVNLLALMDIGVGSNSRLARTSRFGLDRVSTRRGRGSPRVEPLHPCTMIRSSFRFTPPLSYARAGVVPKQLRISISIDLQQGRDTPTP